jgi:hypothetical protein
MNKYTKKQKVAVALGAGAIAIAGGGVALAYWTSTGSADNSASTSTGAADLTVTPAAAPTDMAPGVAAEPLSATVLNNAVNKAQVSKVIVSITGITQAGGAVGTCTASDYTLSGATMTTGAAELAHNASTTFTGASIGFNDDPAVNQDGCKGATVALHYAVS